MHEAKNTARSLVKITADGSVQKWYRGTDAASRFENELRVLNYLQRRGCGFVPRVLAYDRDTLLLVTTNCGQRVQQISDEKLKSLFIELETYGVRHDDPFLRNVTYRLTDGRFCIIDFELATILDEVASAEEVAGEEESLSGTVSLDAVNVRLAEQARQQQTPYLLRWSGCTDRGRFRPNNEDAFLSLSCDRRDLYYLGRTGEAPASELDFVFGVSDGMGGERSGEFASRFALDSITRVMPRRFGLWAEVRHTGMRDLFEEIFQSTHRQLTTLGRSYEQGRNMGATLSLLWFENGFLHFGHLGDSRIYHLPSTGGIQQLTEDHTHVGWLRRQGKLNEREARQHPRRNVLTQSLGAGAQYVHPHLGECAYSSGDFFVAVTDGITDGLWDRGIEELVRNPPAKYRDLPIADRLVRAAVDESGRDNATAVVVEITTDDTVSRERRKGRSSEK
ncbi:MAG: protein phosphatase 2C domain-containing protein [Planctomycetota bacterium]